MAFTAKDVQTLREKTNVGMMDCKKALTEADGDMDKAIDILREKGLATAAKKAGRTAAEGVIAVCTVADITAIVEFNCETDFVAKNPEFVALANAIAKTAAEQKPADLDALNAAVLSGGSLSVADSVQELFLKIRENLKVRRFELISGVTATYIHGGGTVGVVVSFAADDATAAKGEFITMGKDVAMQIAAMSPLYLDEASVPADVLEHEKAINLAQLNEDEKNKNKPEQVKAKIIEGKIKKYYSDVCLVNQAFVKDGDITVAQYIENTAKALGASVKATGFIRYAKGEGIEKKADNFAEEIANMVK